MVSQLSLKFFLLSLVFTVSSCDAEQPISAQTNLQSSAANNAKAQDCEKAKELLATCTHEEECSLEMTTMLPSAARSTYVALSKKPWFSEDKFDKHCINACLSRGTEIDTKAFEAEVCSTKKASVSAQPA